jgi:small subunit ribosomal protein S1
MAQARVYKEIENPFTTGESFADMFKASNADKLEEGAIVTGVVVAIDEDAVTVDIGFKSEGRIALKDFPESEREDLAIGSEVSAFVERIENNKQELVLSRNRAVQEESWKRLERMSEKKENVDGRITSRVKGGFVVDLGGCVAFLPGSQVDVRPVKDVTPLMNIVQPFQVIKMDRKRGNIIVSRRAILEESLTEERSAVLANIAEGSVLDGVVKNITDYGAFVDFGAVDGLLHVTDISWSRINHPSEVLKVGEKVTVKVIKFDQNTKRISLGLKQLKDNPWDSSDGKYAEGTKHKGRITNLTDYGVFVELDSGIEGLVHVSEISWTKKNVAPNTIYKKGDEVEVLILSIEPAKQRLSLGIKQTQANPWEDFAKKHSKEQVVEGTIKSITDFGIFVGFDGHPEIDGLIHADELSWGEEGAEELKKYTKGDKISAKIIDLDANKEKIALSVRQLGDDPFATALSAFAKGGIFTFPVTQVKENGIEVQVAEGITSFIKKADLSKDKVECRPERFAVGDRVDAKVVGMDPKNKSIKLSIRAFEIDEEKNAIEKFGSADSGAKLGSILGEALSSAKIKAAK